MSHDHRAKFGKELMFPPLPLEAWQGTRPTLHLYLQIVGKIRLALFPRLNHWWHVPLYVSACGLTTNAIPYDYGNLEIEFDFIEHRLMLRTSNGSSRHFSLQDGLSVSE